MVSPPPFSCSEIVLFIFSLLGTNDRNGYNTSYGHFVHNHEKEIKMKLENIYLQEEFYNPRIKATISGAWIAEFSNGQTMPICGQYEAKTKEEACQILCENMEG